VRRKIRNHGIGRRERQPLAQLHAGARQLVGAAFDLALRVDTATSGFTARLAPTGTQPRLTRIQPPPRSAKGVIT
jgi:hypothetical protein